MTVRSLLVVAVVMAAVTLLGFAALDAPLARTLGPDAGTTAIARGLGQALDLLDRVSGMNLPKEWFAVGWIVAGCALWRWRRPVGAGLVLIGLTHAVSRTLGGHLKPLTGRLRPSEALARHHLDDTFGWVGGVGFPSGHVAHYGALAFAIAVLFPRARVPALLVLALVIAARISRNAHFVSDVSGSLAIAALACAGFTRLLAPR